MSDPQTLGFVVPVTIPEFHAYLARSRDALGLAGRGNFSLVDLRDKADTDPQFPHPVDPHAKVRRYRLPELVTWMSGAAA